MVLSATVQDIKLITFPVHSSPEADLFVYEHDRHVPFAVRRVFTVDAHQACDRGAHAHKACTQLLVSLKGRILVTVKDGMNESRFDLDTPKTGVLMPPGLWGEQSYEAGSLLMVLTDQPYDEGDYIRDYRAFEHYKKGRA